VSTAVVGTPAVERDLAFDMVRRGLWAAPAIVLVAGLIWGGDGAWSALLAIAVVLVNLAVSALALSWAARVSATAIMAVAMFGFAVRMAVLTLVVYVVKDEPWIDLVALGVTILVTHLGLLFWELRYVSASLAFPGLKPGVAKEASRS
jgi:ATP synthase I chain